MGNTERRLAIAPGTRSVSWQKVDYVAWVSIFASPSRLSFACSSIPHSVSFLWSPQDKLLTSTLLAKSVTPPMDGAGEACNFSRMGQHYISVVHTKFGPVPSLVIDAECFPYVCLSRWRLGQACTIRPLITHRFMQNAADEGFNFSQTVNILPSHLFYKQNGSIVT